MQRFFSIHGLARRAHLLFAIFLLAGCATDGERSAPEAVDLAVRVDSLIAPHRRELVRQMEVPLAICPVEMRTGRPEGLLGALMSDIVLARARQAAAVRIDACVLNDGGFRIPWSPGPITLGLVYEVMPFDNTIMLLRLSSAQMESLADQLAADGGAPVAGLGLAIQGERATDLLISGTPLEERDYWIATNNYLAQGGGGLPVLWESQEVRETGILIRTAIADAVRAYGATRAGNLGELPVPEMGRIRAEQGGGR